MALLKPNAECDYYEDSYDNRCWGLTRFCTNFYRQTFANYECKMKFVIAVAMAAIEVFEFLATF